MKSKETPKIFLDSIDYFSDRTCLNHFLIPDKTEFTSFKELMNYAINRVPNDSLEAYAHLHCGIKSVVVLLSRVLVDGSVEYFRMK